jgi:stage II sporulation protein R
MRLRKWEISLIIAVVMTLISGASLAAEQRELSDKLIRLHVVANSDSPEDQELKLRVRDRLLTALSSALNGAGTRGEAIDRIGQSLDIMEQIAADEIARSGYSYPVRATIERENFPTREYDTFSLPAGEYESLRVVIGEADGKNWWCVVFPPLCTGELKRVARETLSDDEWALITGETGGFVVKFRLIELLDKITKWFGI